MAKIGKKRTGGEVQPSLPPKQTGHVGATRAAQDRLPPELFVKIAQHLPSVPYTDKFEPTAKANVRALSAVRLASRAWAHAVDAKHSEFIAQAASIAASRFLDDPSDTQVVSSELREVLARTPTLALTMREHLKGSAGLRKLEALLEAAPSLHTLRLLVSFVAEGEAVEPVVRAPRLTSLTKLTIDSHDGQAVPPLLLDLPRPDRLLDLNISSDCLDEPRAIYDLLARTTQLRHLRLDGFELNRVHQTFFSIEALAQCQQLQSLALEGAYALNHVRAGELLRRLPNLRALTLHGAGYGNNGQVGIVQLPHPPFSAPQPQLVSLRLSAFALTSQYLRQLDLAAVPNLRTLDLSGNFFFGDLESPIPPLNLTPLKQLERLVLKKTNLPMVSLERSGAAEAIASGRLKLMLTDAT